MIYAEDLFILNEGALGLSQGVNVSLISKYSQQSPKYVHLLPVSCQNSPEVSQIEKNSQKILDGMMDGATRVLTIFGPIVGMKEEDIDHALHEIFPPAAFTPRILFREKLKGFLRRFTRRFFRK